MNETSLIVTTANQEAYDIHLSKHTINTFMVNETVTISAKGNVLETNPAQVKEVLSIKKDK